MIRMERIAEGCMDEGRKREGERERETGSVSRDHPYTAARN